MGLKAKEALRVCDSCGYKLISEQWEKMERANGKHFQIRHKGEEIDCGGRFVAAVTEIGKR